METTDLLYLKKYQVRHKEEVLKIANKNKY